MTGLPINATSREAATKIAQSLARRAKSAGHSMVLDALLYEEAEPRPFAEVAAQESDPKGPLHLFMFVVTVRRSRTATTRRVSAPKGQKETPMSESTTTTTTKRRSTKSSPVSLTAESAFRAAGAILRAAAANGDKVAEAELARRKSLHSAK